MAKETTKKSSMSMDDMLKQYQKDYGKEIGSFGGNLVSAERIPTGCFPFDLATGGGFPRGKCSIIYGPESSGKTNLALLAIASHQVIWPDQKCVFVDVEHALDPTWATKLGVDMSKLIVVEPSYGEQLVDMVEGFLYASDCGIVVIDSLAAIIATVEVENSAEKKNYGGNSILIGAMCRKTTLALAEAEKKGNHPSLIYINQVRTKLGVMYGSPEDMPGGNAPRFQTSFWVRLYGKNIMDNKVNQALPVIKEINFIMKKWKAPIIAASGKMEMVMIPHNGFQSGEVDDWKTVSEYLKNFDQFNKKEGSKGGWIILDEEYPTMQAFKDRLFKDKTFGQEVRTAIIQRVLQDGNMLNATEPEEWGEV